MMYAVMRWSVEYPFDGAEVRDDSSMDPELIHHVPLLVVVVQPRREEERHGDIECP